MRAPCQRVHRTGYRGRTKEVGIGLADQGRPASGPAGIQEAARENFSILVHGVSGRGARKSPALRTALARRCGKVQTVATIMASTSQLALPARLADRSTTPLRANSIERRYWELVCRF